MTAHEWKNIASAPRGTDETLILATIENGDVVEIFTGVWDTWDSDGGWISHQHCSKMKPTHWTPLLSLPAPPDVK
jgi:hypothetical protein